MEGESDECGENHVPIWVAIPSTSDTKTSTSTSPLVARLLGSDTLPSKQRPFEPIQGQLEGSCCSECPDHEVRAGF